MGLLTDLVKKNDTLKPPRVLIYGGPGLGKTTFAAQAPNPVFLLTEDGLGLNQVDAFPLIKTKQQVHDYLKALFEDENDYKTIVIDSLDWLDLIIREEIKKQYENNKDALAFGKDHLLVEAELRSIFKKLDFLAASKNMMVINIAHQQIKQSDTKVYDTYDRHIPKLSTKAAALAWEWHDCVFFAAPNIIVTPDSGNKNSGNKKGKTKDVHIGKTKMFTRTGSGFEAKNRYNLPDEMELDYKVFDKEYKKAIATNNKGE